jgi:hypothetical protein
LSDDELNNSTRGGFGILVATAAAASNNFDFCCKTGGEGALLCERTFRRKLLRFLVEMVVQR